YAIRNLAQPTAVEDHVLVAQQCRQHGFDVDPAERLPHPGEGGEVYVASTSRFGEGLGSSGFSTTVRTLEDGQAATYFVHDRISSRRASGPTQPSGFLTSNALPRLLSSALATRTLAI